MRVAGASTWEAICKFLSFVTGGQNILKLYVAPLGHLTISSKATPLNLSLGLLKSSLTILCKKLLHVLAACQSDLRASPHLHS